MPVTLTPSRFTRLARMTFVAKHVLSGSRIKFFLELGFKVAELRDWAERSFNKLLQAGLTNEWPVFIPKSPRPCPRQTEIDFPASTYDEVPDEFAEGFGWDFDSDIPLNS